MKYLKVNLWGKEIGRLVKDEATRRIYFMYNPACAYQIPDIAPLLSPARSRRNHLPVYGDDRPEYQGLPPFISDSLPDSWGNTLFEKWVADNRVPRNKVTPLYKLMFIGTRGMGALEYEPAAAELTHSQTVDIKSLYDLSLKVLADRNDVKLNVAEELTLQSLLAVGTSAGGRQMKAIIAINEATGEIRSGQTECPDGFEYYILKFGDSKLPLAEIETAYYMMATDAGITMSPSRLMPVGGINHFLTKRFDRKDGKKVHIQTLSAINPEARNYEDLIATCRSMSIAESEVEQIFYRLVFNVLANNTDDHNKNFSFMLEENGRWRLAPAYDMTFIFNSLATGPNISHRFSIAGMTSDFTPADLIRFARENDLKNPEAIMKRIAGFISRFDEYAERCGISQPWRSIIQKTLDENLATFGYRDRIKDDQTVMRDCNGRRISDISISVNSKGQYEVSVTIDGKRRRRFIKRNMPEYNDFSNRVVNLTPDDKVALVRQLFPPEL